MLKGILIKYDRKWTLVYKRHAHFCSENAGLDHWHSLLYLFDHIFIEFLGHLRLPCLYKTRSISFSAVGVQRKL